MAWHRQITMNTTLRLSAALALLVTAAACATPTTAGSAGGSNPPDTGATSSPVARPPSGTSPATRPNEATPNAQAVDLRPTRWDRVTADGRRLTVHYTATGLAACHTLGRVDVKETPRTITVTLHVGKLPERRLQRTPTPARRTHHDRGHPEGARRHPAGQRRRDSLTTTVQRCPSSARSRDRGQSVNLTASLIRSNSRPLVVEPVRRREERQQHRPASPGLHHVEEHVQLGLGVGRVLQHPLQLVGGAAVDGELPVHRLKGEPVRQQDVDGALQPVRRRVGGGGLRVDVQPHRVRR